MSGVSVAGLAPADLEILKLSLLIAIVVGASVFAVMMAIAVGWFFSRGKASTNEVEGLAVRVSTMERGFGVLEERLGHMPNRETVHGIANSVARLDARTEFIGRDVEGLKYALQRVETFLYGREAPDEVAEPASAGLEG